jgi:ribosomal-protein-alanine N-acetyltransferase
VLVQSFDTKRFIVRVIDPHHDSLNNYLTWMTDIKSNPFIDGVRSNFTVDELKQYISEKNSSEDAVLLGIYEKISGNHIGNIKLEPIIKKSMACLGILIGEVNMRGKLVGFEVISSALVFARDVLFLNSLYLGVSRDNIPALKLYEKIGFIQRLPSRYIENDLEMYIDLK